MNSVSNSKFDESLQLYMSASQETESSSETTSEFSVSEISDKVSHDEIDTHSTKTTKASSPRQEKISRSLGLWEPASNKHAMKKSTSPEEEELQKRKRRHVVVAFLSVLIAILNYLWIWTHPLTPVQLLADMQQNSAPATVIGTNGKPSLVDFWAPWCENCKLEAATLQKVEEEYKDKVNFVMVNGDLSDSWPYIEAFRVDAIPHLALVNADGDVETALIGLIPKSVLEADLNALLEPEKKRPLPFEMLDVFSNQPEKRRVHFDP